MRITIELTRPRLPRRLAILVAAAALAIPAAVVASHQFADVPTGASYHDDVEALFNAGVTTGCGGGNFCPGSPVTRGQMAQFLNRLGALAPDTTPVVNAAALDGLGATDFMPSATYINSLSGELVANGQSGLSVSCDAGDLMLSGGFQGLAPATTILETYPVAFNQSWNIWADNGSEVSADPAQIHVVCADFAPLHVEEG